MNPRILVLGAAFALASSCLAQAAVDSGLPVGDVASHVSPATSPAMYNSAAGFWGICGPGRYYQEAVFVEIYSGGVLQGAIYTRAGCYTPA